MRFFAFACRHNRDAFMDRPEFTPERTCDWHRGDCVRQITSSLLLFALVVAVSVPFGCRRAPTSTPEASKQKQSTTNVDAAHEAPVTASSGLNVEPEVEPAPPAAMPVDGKELFARHCAACHGERGDGKGIAAAFLFPKPRDLQAGKFRLVSTNNAVPTRDDLHAVLERGMPGSAMPPWAHLSPEEREALVEEVIRLRAEGAREDFVTILKEDDGLTDEEIAAEEIQAEIQDVVDEAITPGESTEVPEFSEPTPESVARGKEVYAKFACIQCHGETGRGDGAAAMVDDEGMPTSPRDFTLGIFKGKHDPASLYRRIAYGMPGSPMPSSSTMSPEQMMDLVHFIRSLSSEVQREAAVMKRLKFVAKRVELLPGLRDEDVWNVAEPVSLKLTPLWWRSDADADFRVQAVHDGKAISVRMSWKDGTFDDHALRGEKFEDAVALQLYRGAAEPFLGMGDANSPVDVWFWDADRQRGAPPEREYPDTVVDVYPFSEAGVTVAELDRAGARMEEQPGISLPARAVGNRIMPDGDKNGGSSLQVAGPRTVTFRIPQSEIVQAHGEWADGRWTVVMTRALLPSSESEGMSLRPGEAASIAFAVWDGSHADRNGQKSITIWQDLVLEP